MAGKKGKSLYSVSLARKQAAKKQAARRLAKKASSRRPFRSKKKPVKVVFQCIHGKGTSKSMTLSFKEFLQEKGLAELFHASFLGIPKGHPSKDKGWRQRIRHADFLVSFDPAVLKRHNFQPPKKVKTLYTSKYSSARPPFAFEARKLFEDLVRQAGESFRLVKPKKPEKPENQKAPKKAGPSL